MDTQHTVSSGLRTFIKEELRVGDWIVVTFFLCVCIFSSIFIYNGRGEGRGFRVVISGKKTGTFPLSESGVKIVQSALGKFTLRVSEGRVFLESAPCKNKTCLGMGGISGEGEVIVCAPGGLIIEIVGGEKHPELDGITK